MKKTIWDVIKALFPLGAQKRKALHAAMPYLSEEDVLQLKYYLKLDRCFSTTQSFGTSRELFEDKEWPNFKSHLQEKEVDEFIARIDHDIEEKARHEAFLAFAPHALERITARMAPNILGMEEAKAACALQLFAKEPFHILLIGDPGTGKTDILRSLHQMAAISSFGLGSGTSGVGLAGTAKGDTIIKGLLPLADGGIACIDELNLMKGRDSASLYNAMEKGFVTYDKGGKHEQLPAKVRVCATANPTGDTFVGRAAEVLKKQIPFDDALLSRFHLLFIVRKPTDEEFGRIAAHIVASDSAPKKGIPAGDTAFIKEYVRRALDLDVQLDPSLEAMIVSFVKELKADQSRFIVEIGPRTVVGVVRVVKAVARSESATAVSKSHVETACKILRDALHVRRPDEEKGRETERHDPR